MASIFFYGISLANPPRVISNQLCEFYIYNDNGLSFHAGTFLSFPPAPRKRNSEIDRTGENRRRNGKKVKSANTSSAHSRRLLNEPWPWCAFRTKLMVVGSTVRCYYMVHTGWHMCVGAFCCCIELLQHTYGGGL